MISISYISCATGIKTTCKLYRRLIYDWFYLTRLMPSVRTDLGTSGQSLALSHPIHVSSAIINSLIVRSIGYIARFFLSVHPRQNIPPTP
jgi:hypothetical protein